MGNKRGNTPPLSRIELKSLSWAVREAKKSSGYYSPDTAFYRDVLQTLREARSALRKIKSALPVTPNPKRRSK